MRSRQPASDSYRSRIIDVDVNEPRGADGGPEAPNASDASDASDTNPRLRPQSFRDRHALKVMGVLMVGMFATVIIAQVGC